MSSLFSVSIYLLGKYFCAIIVLLVHYVAVCYLWQIDLSVRLCVCLPTCVRAAGPLFVLRDSRSSGDP